MKDLIHEQAITLRQPFNTNTLLIILKDVKSAVEELCKVNIDLHIFMPNGCVRCVHEKVCKLNLGRFNLHYILQAVWSNLAHMKVLCSLCLTLLSN